MATRAQKVTPATLPDKQLITIYQGGARGARVSAPLPDNFGFSLANDISAPFGAYALAGDLTKLLALYGVGTEVGLTSTKFFTGMNQPDISADLTFKAYESSKKDVMVPVLTLATMSSGIFLPTIGDKKVGTSKTSAVDIITWILNKVGATVDDLVKEFGGTPPLPQVQESTIASFFKYVQAPKKLNVQFGRVFTLKDVYISSFDVQFNNQLDIEGYPMAATVSLSITPAAPLDQTGILSAFAVPNSKKAPSPTAIAQAFGGGK